MFPSNTKTLVVDDMMTMRKIVKKCLKDGAQIEADEAVDGNEAWAKIELAVKSGQPYQLIISDWNMPNMLGIELLKKVRENETLKTIPFILVTAESEASQVTEGIKAGVSSYIVKPFSANDFMEKLLNVYKKTQK